MSPYPISPIANAGFWPIPAYRDRRLSTQSETRPKRMKSAYSSFSVDLAEVSVHRLIGRVLPVKGETRCSTLDIISAGAVTIFRSAPDSAKVLPLSTHAASKVLSVSTAISYLRFPAPVVRENPAPSLLLNVPVFPAIPARSRNGFRSRRE